MGAAMSTTAKDSQSGRLPLLRLIFQAAYWAAASPFRVLYWLARLPFRAVYWLVVFVKHLLLRLVRLVSENPKVIAGALLAALVSALIWYLVQLTCRLRNAEEARKQAEKRHLDALLRQQLKDVEEERQRLEETLRRKTQEAEEETLRRHRQKEDELFAETLRWQQEERQRMESERRLEEAKVAARRQREEEERQQFQVERYQSAGSLPNLLERKRQQLDIFQRDEKHRLDCCGSLADPHDVLEVPFGAQKIVAQQQFLVKVAALLRSGQRLCPYILTLCTAYVRLQGGDLRNFHIKDVADFCTMFYNEAKEFCEKAKDLHNERTTQEVLKCIKYAFAQHKVEFQKVGAQVGGLVAGGAGGLYLGSQVGKAFVGERSCECRRPNCRLCKADKDKEDSAKFWGGLAGAVIGGIGGMKAAKSLVDKLLDEADKDDIPDVQILQTSGPRRALTTNF